MSVSMMQCFKIDMPVSNELYGSLLQCCVSQHSMSISYPTVCLNSGRFECVSVLVLQPLTMPENEMLS